MMKFSTKLLQATFLKRYKRFLADIQLESGEIITAHCPNTGSMTNCLLEGSPCWISEAENPQRKTRFTWELATTPEGAIACINTHRANALIKEALVNGRIAELQGFDALEPEKTIHNRRRCDFLLHNSNQDHPKKQKKTFVEVKSVTLAEGTQGYFPDSHSERAIKQIEALSEMIKQGHQATIIFCVQHSNIEHVAPADHITPAYGKALRQGVANGINVIAYKTHISTSEMYINKSLRIEL